MTVRQSVESLLRAGAHRVSDLREQRRIVVSNVIALLLAANTLMYAVVLFSLGLYALGLSLIPNAVLRVLPVWLNHKGWFTAARFALITTANVTIFTYVMVLGIRGEVSLFYAAACVALLVCNLKDKWVILWGIGLSITCATVIEVAGDSLMGAHLLSPAGEFRLHMTVMLGTFGILLAVVLSFEVSNARAEDGLRGAHHDIKRLLDRVDQGFATLDGAGRIRAERSAAFDQWFHTPATGTPFGECLGQLDPEVGLEFQQEWSAVADARHERLEVALAGLPSRISAGGRDYRIDYRRDPATPDSVEGLMVITSDVTAERDRARAEEKQQALQLELAQSQKLESVGRLAAGVAHEINTPIQYIGDSVHFVRSGMDDLRKVVSEYRHLLAAVTDGTVTAQHAAAVMQAEEEADLEYLLDKVPQALDRATDGVQRVATIVQSMKEFAHPDADEKEPADLNRALLSTITVAGSAVNHVADVTTDLAEIPMVHCFLGSLNQVFLNLIVNAADAIGERVAGTDQRGRITIKTGSDQESVLISIGDDGAGVPEAVKARIFDQFFTTKAVGTGTGQGLALAHRIVTNHGGRISFESTVGEGTTFLIRLPIDPTSCLHNYEKVPM